MFKKNKKVVPGNTKVSQPKVYFYEDFSVNDLSESLVGKKALSLFQLVDKDIPVPPFFAISPVAYKEFVLNVFDRNLPKLLKELKNPDYIALERLFLKAPLPDDVMKSVKEAYTRLSGFSNAWIAVRSSIVYPHDEKASFPGIFQTMLNVRGFEHLEEAIKRVYLSMFTESAIDYALNNNIDLRDAQMAIVVQRMVQPEVSGVAYTEDPVTQDRDKLMIEAVFGLGDVIATGEIRPDLYILDKTDLSILEKHISPQEWMKIRRLKPKRETSAVEEFEKIPISRVWSHQQKFEDHFIEEVGRIAKLLEGKDPVVMEWVFESGKVWVLQVKMLKAQESKKKKAKVRATVKDDTLPKDPFDLAVDLLSTQASKQMIEDATGKAQDDKTAKEIAVEEEKIERKIKKEIQEKQKFSPAAGKTLENDMRQVKRLSKLKRIVNKFTTGKNDLQKSNANSVEKIATTARSEYLLSGVAVSAGRADGRVVLLDKLEKGVKQLPSNAVVVFVDYDPKYEKFISQAAGVIADDGGVASDIASLCREYKIPAVLGTGLSTYILKDGDLVQVDGDSGAIYRLVEEKTQMSFDDALHEDESIDETNMKVISEDKIDEEISTSTDTKIVDKHEKPIIATKVYVTAHKRLLTEPEPVMSLVDGIFHVDLDVILLDQKRHLLAFVAEKKFREFSTTVAKIIDEYAALAAGKEVVVTLGSHTLGDFRKLVRGKSAEDAALDGNLSGALRYTSSPEMLKRALAIVRRVRNVHNRRNVSLAVHGPVNPQVMKEFKKYVTAGRLRRSSTFKLYAIFNSATEIMLAEQIIGVGLDGVVLDSTKLLEAVSGGAPSKMAAKKSLTTIIEDFVTKHRGHKERLMLDIADNTELVELGVTLGVHDIIMTHDVVKDTVKEIAALEVKKVVGV